MDKASDNQIASEAEPAHQAEGTSESRTAESLDFEATRKAIAASGVALYRWTISDDKLSWSNNAGQVLGCDPALLSTGKKFAAFLDSENITSRYDTVMHSNQLDESGDGVAFEIEYCFRPDGRQQPAAVWLEDIGRWFGGDDGRPQVVFGQLRAVDKRHQRDQEMNFLSHHDALTGMMNRTRMLAALDEAIANAKTEKTSLAFVLLSVKNLDIMNEAYGFEVADEVIVAMAQRLRRVMRMGDGIARYSGSRFGMILNSCKPQELAPALERFMQTVRDSVIETKLGPVWALLSIGAVSLPALGECAADATARAEEALSEAMRLPTDGYVIYTSSRERDARRMHNARCATEIVNCLRDGLFSLAYQPIVDINGNIALHEALLRMRDSTGAMIAAAYLVPIAENLGLIRLIDRVVVRLALKTLAEYQEARLSVNLSATTVSDPRWHAQILELISNAADLAPRLTIEITETAALGDVATTRAFLTGLRHLGCGIAIDDFGAGFTSYRNLKELPLTMIKLDGSYCRNLDSDEANSIYVRNMLELAHTFGLKVAAECVENDRDAQRLRALGVDMLQGNHFGEPDITPPWAHGKILDAQAWEASEVEVTPLTKSGKTWIAPEQAEVTYDPEPPSATEMPDLDTADTEESLALLRRALKELQDAFNATAPVQSESLAQAS